MTRVDAGGPPRLPPLVTIPAGRHLVGTERPSSLERPLHEVALAAFRVAVRPVTNEEYDRFVAATGHDAPPFANEPTLARPDAPVVGVSWFDARAYLDWLRAETGLPARLPTEDEREVAARGGRDARRWPWGDRPPEEVPELRGIAALDRPHVPGEECANELGLSCLADNVHEWCSDRLASAAVERRVSRGGSFRHRVKFTPVAARSSLPPDRRYADYGFRVFADA